MNTFFNTKASYSLLAKFFHWVIASLVILMLLFSYFLGDIPNKIMQGIAYNAHKLTGLTIFALMLFRVVWMLMNPKPTFLNSKAWERWAERLVHWSLYLALLLMPLAGWIGSVAGGRPPQWASFKFNLPIEKSESLSDLAFSVHNTLAIIIIVLVSLHVLAALFHHFVRKDEVLQRMLP